MAVVSIMTLMVLMTSSGDDVIVMMAVVGMIQGL